MDVSVSVFMPLMRLLLSLTCSMGVNRPGGLGDVDGGMSVRFRGRSRSAGAR